MAATTETKPAANVAVKGGVVTYLNVDGALKAAEFYRRAFGAEQAMAYPPDDKGRTMHVHLYINGSSVMVDDIEAWWQRAIDAGATPVMPPTDMFWGDRYAQLRDPFGVAWAMNQRKR